MNMGNFLDDVFFTVVRIQTLDPTTGRTSVGTGFLYQAALDSNVHSHALFLVSNRHVFGSEKCKLVLTFHKLNSDKLTPSLKEIVSISQSDFGKLYTEHPDKETDLACLNISPIISSNPSIFRRCLAPELLTDSQNPALHAGKEVFFVGYPDNRFDAINHLPILRRGYIAAIPTVDFNGKRQFVIDAQVFPGSSGSPVFVAYGSSFRLLGVVTATMIRSERLEPVDPVKSASPHEFGVRQTIGLGIVIKTEAMRELTDNAVIATLKMIDAYGRLEPKSHVTDFIAATADGEEISITKDENLPVQLDLRSIHRRRRQAGSAKGLIHMKPDFDAPLEEFREYME